MRTKEKWREVGCEVGLDRVAEQMTPAKTDILNE